VAAPELKIPPLGPTVRLAALTLLLAVAHRAAADEIRVATASNFRGAMTALARAFEETHRLEVVPIYGSTGKHYAQIVNGAPFDAFFAADALRPERLEREGLAVAGSRFTYATGILVLWSPREGFVDPEGLVLRSGRFRHLSIANPDLAPYGAAARDVLERLGLWAALGPRLVLGENVGQAFLFVSSGGAELGFVAGSQLVAGPDTRNGSTWRVPEDLYRPIEQQAVLLRESEAARAFLAFIRTAAAARIIGDHGYLPARTDVQ
jgi:molybdate transport system substrate-binding protein